MSRRRWIHSLLLIVAVIGVATALAAWKHAALARSAAEAANQPEPVEAIEVAIAAERPYQRATTVIGTVIATRSITVRNELPGTVRQVSLPPGQIVEAGTVLVALDVSVEQAELEALLAQAQLAETQYARMLRMSRERAASEMEVDSARAERDVALAQIARTRAVIERKTIRAPFRARIGISDVHPGQYLNEGTYLTTLQGVDDSAYIDFSVPQQVAAGLRAGDSVEVIAGPELVPSRAEIVALDARFDPATRNGVVRARLADVHRAPAPGASVRVRVPVGEPLMAVTIPASALRKGPGGDRVFVVADDAAGQARAHEREVAVEALAGDEIVIREGLAPGERVAASGSFKLRDAALVAVVGSSETVAAVRAPGAAAQF